MKITDIKTAVIGGNFRWLLVRVDTDEGISGLGECWGQPGVKETILQKMKPRLLGEDPMDIYRLFLKVMRDPPTPAGSVITAFSGIDMALWDIAGKKLGVPVYRLLSGSRFRDKIRVYADCGSGETREPDSYAERARQALSKGFTALKFDIDHQTPHPRLDMWNNGLSNAEIGHIEEVVGAVREEIGEDIDLSIDAHWSYNISDAIKVARRLEAYNLIWFEDPVPYDNPETYAKISASTKTPICTGEHLHTRHGFRELIVRQAVDIIAPDMANSGGLLECKKISELAEVYAINMAPHNVSSPVAMIGSCHLCTAIPNFVTIEFHSMDVPWYDDLLTGIDKPIIRDGYVKLPEKPGLGVELNEKVAEEHLVEGETLFS